MKLSEVFEGENSGLRIAFDEAVAREQSYTEVRTALPVFIQPLAESIRQAEQKTLERVIEIIKEKGQQQDDGTIWVDMDDLLKSIKNP